MSRFAKSVVALALAAASSMTLAQTQKYPDIGRSATGKEIAAWDIDVRPDFRGLPKGSGTVAKGQQVWEGKCASCSGLICTDTSIGGKSTARGIIKDGEGTLR